MATPPQLASNSGLRQLTGREYHGLAELDRQGLLLETQISEVLHARERLAHQVSRQSGLRMTARASRHAKAAERKGLPTQRSDDRFCCVE
eukprot:scaffold1466_cov249-Pinguiococcus_pyrenoidosus.AAC.16